MMIATPKHEILERAQNRLVMAMISMVAPPEAGQALQPGSAGILIEDGKPLIDVRANDAFIQATQIWLQEDRCTPRVEKDPAILEWAIDNIKSRRKRVVELDDNDVRRATFESEDVLVKSMGIERHITLEFGLVATTGENMFAAVPFEKLKAYLEILQKKLGDIGGHVYKADVEHAPAIKAADYYAQAFNRLHMGRRFNYGDVMLSKGHNILRDVGMPLVTPPSRRKDLN